MHDGTSSNENSGIITFIDIQKSIRVSIDISNAILRLLHFLDAACIKFKKM